VEPRSLINFRGDLIKMIESKGVDVVTVSSSLSDDLKMEFLNKNIRYQAVPFKRNSSSPFSDLKTFWSLFGLFKQERPDSVLAYTIKPVIWCGLAARLRRIRFFALITELGFAFQGTSLKRILLTKLVTFLYKTSLARAEAVIFQNQDDRETFVAHDIVTENKSFVVDGSGVDVSRFGLTSLPENNDNLVFLCVARLLGEKGLREYTQAAGLVKTQFPNTRFVLVGPEDSPPDGISIEEVTQWVANGVTDYKGSASDVRPFIEAAHVYVLASYHEGLPRSSIEAMAMGRSVNTTVAPGCRETVVEGVNGFLIPVADGESLAKKMIWFIADIRGYLPDDILCKVDRCAMYNSLEARIPMLDHRVVEFAIRLPNQYKSRLSSKWPLRELLYKYVPKALIERPKKGFSIPLDIWLRRELKDWAEGLLEVSIVKDQGFFDHKKIDDLWREHQSGERNWSGVLWNILMFQQWLEYRSK